MKKLIALIIVSVFFLFLNSASALAAALEWEFDRAHSRFGFNVKHIFSTVHGTFEDYSGTVLFDPDNLERSKILFEIKVKSIQTGIAKRDNHLRSADFFDADKYPLIIFESTGIRHIEGKEYEVSGRLTMKDVSKEIVLPMTLQGMQTHPMEAKKRVAGFDIKTTLDRLEYRVGDGRFYEMGVVGKDVNVDVSLEMLQNR
jgi:polyisoprenoid-binding protein YceI